jgi:hypothetical protein
MDVGTAQPFRVGLGEEAAPEVQRAEPRLVRSSARRRARSVSRDGFQDRAVGCVSDSRPADVTRSRRTTVDFVEHRCSCERATAPQRDGAYDVPLEASRWYTAARDASTSRAGAGHRPRCSSGAAKARARRLEYAVDSVGESPSSTVPRAG